MCASIQPTTPSDIQTISNSSADNIQNTTYYFIILRYHKNYLSSNKLDDIVYTVQLEMMPSLT